MAAMDSVGAALLPGSVDEASRQSLLAALDAGLARELQDIMSYPEGSAGRLMQPRAASIPAHLTVRQVLNRLRQISARETAVLVVTDDSGKLHGLIDLADVVHADPGTRLEDLLHITTPVRVNALTPREEIVDLFSSNRLRLLPVVDLDDRLLGVIRQSTVIKAAQEEASTSVDAPGPGPRTVGLYSSHNRDRRGWLLELPRTGHPSFKAVVKRACNERCLKKCGLSRP